MNKFPLHSLDDAQQAVESAYQESKGVLKVGEES